METFLKNPFIKFLATFTILVVLWFSLYKYIYVIDGSTPGSNSGLEQQLSIILAKNANWITELFGFNTKLEVINDLVITKITDFGPAHGTWIGEPCNGLKVMGLFAIFIAAFPGPWKHKWWYLIVGIIIIHFANAIRISGLTIIEAKWPAYLDFNHNVTFQVLIYGIIFGLWYIWVQKFSGLNLSKKRKDV